MFILYFTRGSLEEIQPGRYQSHQSVCYLLQSEDVPIQCLGYLSMRIPDTDAYRCLTEGTGGVAFVSHLTVFDFTGRDNDLNPGKDFNLLCPDGTRAGKQTSKLSF